MAYSMDMAVILHICGFGCLDDPYNHYRDGISGNVIEQHKKMNKMISVGSLFSGIGGIELGLERTGNFRTEWFVENNGYARAVLRKHWPGLPIHSDITQMDWSKVAPVDMLTGGFPCQDLSYAGKGAGIKEGSRSGLWKEFYRAIRILRPKFVFVENVSALLSRGLDIVLGDLAAIGYDAEWYCVTASSVGAPHRRDRIFIIAYTSITRRPGKNDVEVDRCSGIGSRQDTQVLSGKNMANSNKS